MTAVARAGPVVAVAAAFGLLVGCGTAPAPAPAPSSVATGPARPPAVASPAVPSPSPDAAACAAHPSSASTVRGIAAAIERGPVLPAGVALFLLDSRMRAAVPGITDPVLAAALAEFVAAIDELDAQGRAGLPPGGNTAQDLVQLDPTRILAAVESVERACAAQS